MGQSFIGILRKDAENAKKSFAFSFLGNQLIIYSINYFSRIAAIFMVAH